MPAERCAAWRGKPVGRSIVVATVPRVGAASIAEELRPEYAKPPYAQATLSAVG